MSDKPNKATPRTWTYEAEPNGITFSIWHDEDTEVAEAQTEAIAALIVKAVNEYDTLESVAQHCEKLRLVINALLTELPDKSIVNGEDNSTFRGRVLNVQASAKQALNQLAAVRSNL